MSKIAALLEPAPVTLAGETSLGQLAALFERCDLVIGGDSGPLHLAAAVGAPTIRLYGPTDIRQFGPWPPGDRHVALAAGLACQPCRMLVDPPCGAVETPACLLAIDAARVTAAARRALSYRAKSLTTECLAAQPRAAEPHAVESGAAPADGVALTGDPC